LEPQKNQIQKMIADPSLRVSIAIWWEPEGGQGGFTMNAGTLNRLASLANEVDFYFA